jgi:uncharacterized membrane protein
MLKIESDDLQIISRHSNLYKKSIDKLLKERVYSDRESWEKFLKLLFISLGVGFTTAGILFFFAYNWADLHKFIKIGLIEGLLIFTVLIVVVSKLSLIIKNILLTGASILVGVLFAVFGQIYQTGANAYDFFLGWTLFITLWVIISNFAPLWLVFLTLINTTFMLYSQQVAKDWSEVFVFTVLFVMNVFFLMVSLFGNTNMLIIKPPVWFTNILALAAVTYSTLGLSIGIFDEYQPSFYPLLIITALVYVAGILFGLKEKSAFYISIISFSLIVIISTFLIKLSSDAGMFFIVSLFVVGSVTFVIKNLIDLQKKWMH